MFEKVKNILQKKSTRTFSHNTVHEYANRLNHLSKHFATDDLNFFCINYERVKQFLKTKNKHTARNLCVSLATVLQAINLDANEYLKLGRELKQKLKPFDNRRSDQVRKNWLEWKQIEAVQEEYENDFEKIRHKLDISSRDVLLYKRYLIVSLMTLRPPLRNDYRILKIVTNEADYEEFKNNKKFNLILISPNLVRLNISCSKVRKYYSPHTFEIPDTGKFTKLFSALQLHRHFIGHQEYLLQTRNNEPYKRDQFSSFLRHLMLQKTGKMVGAKIMRASYYTHVLKKPSKRKAKEMMHSEQIAKQHYIKVDI